ncbi:MAG: M1 family aminopeptidase, partial [candidate division Zixibacteria bacterium]|nr:M1 family aminopeptidase [candidate division Zixibacteria bacterium]
MTASMTCTAAIVLLTLSIPAFAGDQPIPPTDKTRWSDESHRRLADAKRQRLMDSRFTEKMRDAQDAMSTQTNYDVLTYDIRMKLDHDVDTLYGAVKFVARATVDGVAQVEVDFNDGRQLDSIAIPSGTLSFSRLNNTVTVDLDRVYDAGEQFEFDMFYRRSIYFFSFQEIVYLTTLFEPYDARDWWPCKDRMDDKADTFFIAITVDTGFYVGSNGTLDSVVASGDVWQTFYYTEHYPMASYLFSLSISQYQVWHDEWVYNDEADTMPITHAVFPSFYSYSLPRYGILPDALTLLSEMFGQYPFADEKYGHAMSQGWVGMEHQTMSTMGTAEGIFEPDVVIHELAHQWWGDMITCESWGDLWLNEGFATYSEALYFETVLGRPFYHEYMNDMAYWGNL